MGIIASKRGDILITFNPLWETLQKKGITQYYLIKHFGFSTGQLSRLRGNQYVSTHTIEHLCQILDCNVEDIIQYTKDN